MKKSLINRFCLFAPVLLSLIFFSCSTPKHVKYFEDVPDSGEMKTISKGEYTEPPIQVDDILTILIQTVDPQATSMINMGNVPVLNSSTIVSNTTNYNQQAAAGYLVDKSGFVEIPILGRVKALSLTVSELREVLRDRASKFFKDPAITVRLANFKISITGEVARPGQYIVPNEKVSLIDAISMSGDLTIYGKRQNVLLIRENPDGTKTPYRIDLTKTDMMSSPYYYLRQNDIVYVEPNKFKIQASNTNQTKTFTILGAALSVLIVFLTRVK